MMRRYILALWSLLFMGIQLFGFQSIAATTDHPAAKQSDRPGVQRGSLDLTDYQLGARELLPLNGKWWFLWGEFADPGQPFPRHRAHAVAVPEVWNHYQINGEKLSAQGHATFFMQVSVPDRLAGKLALDIPNVGPGYSLYLDGQLVRQVGKPGISAETSVAAYGPSRVVLPNQAGVVDILFHVSNYHYNFGGLWYPIKIGSIHAVSQSQAKRDQWSFFVAGIFSLTILFHLFFWFMRRSDRLTLSYVCVALAALIRMISTDETIILDVFPRLPFDWLMRMEYGAFYLLIAAVTVFMYLAFPRESRRRVSLALGACGAIGGLVALLAPLPWMVALADFYRMVAVFAILYFIYISALAWHNKRDGSRIMLSGGAVFMILALNDILYATGYINTGYGLEFGFLAMVLTQSFLINRRFMNLFAQNRKLLATVEQHNQELTSFAQSLEEQVAQRTTELQSAYEDIKSLALTDELTGLANRRAFVELCRHELLRAERYRHPFVIAMIDIDNFKSVNDTWGHDGGDAVLRTVATTLEQNTREQDRVARWGGEEFIILFAETSIGTARQVAERVLVAVASTKVAMLSSSISVTLTIGLADHAEGTSLEELTRVADARLYAGKEAGKNQVCGPDSRID